MTHDRFGFSTFRPVPTGLRMSDFLADMHKTVNAIAEGEGKEEPEHGLPCLLTGDRLAMTNSTAFILAMGSESGVKTTMKMLGGEEITLSHPIRVHGQECRRAVQWPDGSISVKGLGGSAWIQVESS